MAARNKSIAVCASCLFRCILVFAVRVVVVVVCLGCIQQHAIGMAIGQVVEAHDSVRAQLSSYETAFSYEMKQTLPGFPGLDPPVRGTSVFRTEGERFERLIESARQTRGEAPKQNRKQSLWDGQQYFEPIGVREDGTPGTVWFDEQLDKDDVVRREGDYRDEGALFGLISYRVSIVDLLREQPEAFGVVGADGDLIQIRGVTRFGKLKIWVDPETHLIRRAQLVAERGNQTPFGVLPMTYGVPKEWVPSATVVETKRVTDLAIDYQHIADGAVVPVHAHLLETVHHDIGDQVFETDVRMKKWAFDTTQFPEDAFTLRNVPVGRSVFRFGAPELAYVWDGTKAVPAVDSDVLKVIDELGTVQQAGELRGVALSPSWVGRGWLWVLIVGVAGVVVAAVVWKQRHD